MIVLTPKEQELDFMLDRIFAFFESTEVQPDALTVDDSAAVLLIEVMMADHDLDQR
jgi:hypothetical protein